MTTADRPPCFEPLQWKQWSAAAKHTGGITRGNYCTDCTPDYQRKMHMQSRCTNPAVTFETDEHGFIEGVLPCSNPAHDSQTLDLFTDLPPTQT